MKKIFYSYVLFLSLISSVKITVTSIDNVECVYESLRVAAQEGNLEAVRALIARDSDINEQDKNGLTPLHSAIKNEHIRVIHELISAGANPDLKDKEGKTPYHYAMAKALRYNWTPTWKKIIQMLK